MITGLLAATVMCGGAIASVSPAESIGTTASVMAGTGISLAGRAKRTLAARSPTFLLGEVGLVHPDLDWLELAPTLMLEVEGRVGVGLMPKLRARLPGKRLRVWGVVAVPMFFAPYTMFGAQGGAGAALTVHSRIALVAEFTGTGYFWGSDVPRGSAVAKLDATFGLRVRFR
jgi:hypothetical protein